MKLPGSSALKRLSPPGLRRIKGRRGAIRRLLDGARRKLGKLNPRQRKAIKNPRTRKLLDALRRAKGKIREGVKKTGPKPWQPRAGGKTIDSRHIQLFGKRIHK